MGRKYLKWVYGILGVIGIIILVDSMPLFIDPFNWTTRVAYKTARRCVLSKEFSYAVSYDVYQKGYIENIVGKAKRNQEGMPEKPKDEECRGCKEIEVPGYVSVRRVIPTVWSVGCVNAYMQPNPDYDPDFDTGIEVFNKKPAETVVSLTPAATELLLIIKEADGVDHLIGRSTDSTYPPTALDIEEVRYDPDVGDASLDIDKIHALNPELVLAYPTMSEANVEAIEDPDTVVVVLPEPLDLEGIYANMETVARLTGHWTDIKEWKADLKTRVAAVESALAQVQYHPRVLYILDYNPESPNAFEDWGSVQSGTIEDEIISMAGGVNVGNRMTSFDLEQVVRADPEIILFFTPSESPLNFPTEVEMQRWQKITAVRMNQMYSFPYYPYAFFPGPRIVGTLEELARLFHPELAW